MATPIIDDSAASDLLFPAGFGRGLVPRDHTVQPLKMRSVQMPLIPRSEWSARIKEQKATKSRLSDVWRNAGLKFLDQGPVGYCWAHGPAHAMMSVRALQNQPAVSLSAFAVAATIKGGVDEGAWGALALQFMTERGIPEQKYWPQGSRNLAHGTAECWANAAKYKAGEQWADVAAPAWDRDLSFDQVATCLLTGQPVVGDFMWWGHCVCLLDLVEVEPGSFGVYIVNSWKGWGDDIGGAVLRGSQAIPDNAVALSTTATGQ